eukprot:scaffold117026_cov33-Tisochrysis_lutea.AAC.1
MGDHLPSVTPRKTVFALARSPQIFKWSMVYVRHEIRESEIESLRGRFDRAKVPPLDCEPPPPPPPQWTWPPHSRTRSHCCASSRWRSSQCS